MEGSTRSDSVDKPWDHAWSTEEMRKNRRDWSLAGDSGLLKHLQQFSDNLTKKTNETLEAINSITSQLNETAILVDNITNTSLALANTQFIESRVQEDNIEIEQPVENATKNEDDHEFSATDLLVSVCESIRQGLSIMDEKYEKVEVVASDSEDEDDNVPSVLLKPKDPYQDRPLPYVIGTEKWKSSNKVGLESSSSESENDDEDESVSDTDDKNVGSILNPNARTNLGIGRLSSTSSESNDYNIESNKDTDNSRLHARSQDTLNSDTEPTTPSSVLPKTQNINNGPPSFAEELAKRLGNVLPVQKNVIAQDSSEQHISRSKDDIFSPEDDQDVFNNKSNNNIFSEDKNLFSEKVSSSSWKNKPVRPVNKNIIPPSIDVPPPLSNFSSAPKSTIDDLFGDADDSEDSDDIFSKKTSKDIFAAEREAVRSEVVNKQKNPHIDIVQNISTMTTSTPETNDKGKGLFEDEDDDDLFRVVSKQVKTPDTSSTEPTKKKPVGGVSIFGKVDILSSSKFARRPSSSSSSESDSSDHRVSSNASENAAGQSVGSSSTSKSNSSSGANVSSSIEAGNNVNGQQQAGNNTGSSSSSGISVRQPSSDNTAGSSLGADLQPLMSSTRLKSEEIYNRERVPSDSLFAGRSRTNNDSSDQQQPRVQPLVESVSEHEDVFGPPPLPGSSDGPRQKSKVASLFDDSDSGDDLFASASPGSRSLRSSERTPSKTTQNPPQSKNKGLFDDDENLFGPIDAPNVDLFAAAPVKSLAKATQGLFDDATDGLFQKPKPADKDKPTVSSLFAETKESVSSLFGESSTKISVPESKGSLKKPFKSDKVPEEKKPPASSKGLFEDSEDGDLFMNVAKSAVVAEKSSTSFKSIFEDTSDSDLFGSSSKNVLDKKIVVDKSSDSLFKNSKEQSDLYSTKDTKTPEDKALKEEPAPNNLFVTKSKASKPKKLTTSIFDDSDEDDQDLFSGSSFSKKATDSNYSSLFGEDKSSNVAKKMEEKKKIEAEKSVPPPMENKSEEHRPVPKIMESSKSSIFDDDDDDDDLFGEKKKKKESSKLEKSAKDEIVKNVETKKSMENKTKTDDKLEIASKKAIFAEIKQKLEKHKLEQTEGRPVKSESSVVDGAVSSKKEPPKTLKIQTTAPEESSSNQQPPPKKPVVSGKIKNLMGKMGDLKILSPTDTPPLWRKNNEEKSSGSNEDDQEAATSGDLGSSEASTPSLPSGGSSPQTSGTNSRTRDSPSLKSDNTEVAISFDEPAQVETLASIASKSRVRIPAKRRPQSRQARHSALRQSGIDFDIVDTSPSNTNVDQLNGDVHLDVDHLLPSGRTEASERSSRHEAGAHTDDKSEISASRNTTGNLLSPSTDEEDLFDVPPDLPEDPAAKEESLFGRAPILSPIDPIEKPNIRRKTESMQKEKDSTSKSQEGHKEEKEEKVEQKSKAPLDPLRDESHDPLKDPSSLFAFVTKTPSPEKNQGLLLNEDDDSLFSSSSKSTEKVFVKKSTPGLDLFVDDDDISGSDLFSSNKAKIKKPLKDTKIDLFDDVTAEDDDNLFGSISKKNISVKSEESSPAISAVTSAVPKVDDKNEHTLKQKDKNVSKNKEESIKKSKPKTAVKDIFDNSSDDDDIFAGSIKTIPKKSSKSLFDDEEDNDDEDIFGQNKSSSTEDRKAVLNKDRPIVKKAVTRDLKKTAEKIVEKDPLSLLQDN